MSYRIKAIAAAALSFAALATLAPTGFANAADATPPPPTYKKAKPVPDLPFFFVIDDRVSFSWMPNGTDPGNFTINPNGTINGNTAKQVYSFTHFDAWAYGTNFFTASLFKSDHNDPANPCTGSPVSTAIVAGGLGGGGTGDCAGATEVYGLIRSTFGWNELFNTKMFSVGALHNISFEIGADAEVENTFLAPAKRDFVAGLQFAFDLPYKGYINIVPLAYYEFNHNAFDQCGLFNNLVGSGCLLDGDTNFHPTWAVEINYYMDLGFLPENMQYFAISGRAGFYGPKGNENAPLVTGGLGNPGTATKTEINSEPIRLTFDASKAIWGQKYSQFVTTWVAYRYWQNKFGLDHNDAPGVCTIAGTGTPSTNSCTEQTVYAGITLKF
jgi:hypothetical protein